MTQRRVPDRTEVSLQTLLGAPMAVERFLPLAVGMAAVLAELHRRREVHGKITPEAVLVDSLTGAVSLTGASATGSPSDDDPRMRRSRDAAILPGYMSPEQTGRMNRVVDYRTDLYSLGLVFYEMLAGHLPFHAETVSEWVHCQIARPPQPVSEVVPQVPALLSALVMKLLSKKADERYQSAAGLKDDLARCRRRWQKAKKIDPFGLDEGGLADRLVIPQRLFGREQAVETLFAAFGRTVASGGSEVVMVAGYSGVGKTSLVRELSRTVIEKRGFFLSGKCDQVKRDVPYAGFAEAFRELIRQLLAESAEQVADWKRRLQEALGPNGRLIVEVVPQLALIIGDPLPPPELPPPEAENRFLRVFSAFVGVFAQKKHPLVVFLDDLQWADAASLGLLEQLGARAEIGPLLLIGAYRDNEVDPSHPLISALEEIRAAGAPVRTLSLSPLSKKDLTRLIAATVHADREAVEPLARLVFAKTRGNPFFVRQFLGALYQEGLLAFDPDRRAWRWDLAGIEDQGLTDNVVELMLGRLKRLPERTLAALKLAACFGNEFDLQTLAKIGAKTEEEMAGDLVPALREGLVSCEKNYAFLHDRVQEATYAFLPEEERAAVHLRIGRLLLTGPSEEHLAERVFTTVSHLNRGVPMLVDQGEKERVAELNLLAGRRAKAAAAYRSAADFLAAGMALLPADGWERRYELTFALHLERATCEWSGGCFEASLGLLETLMAHARSRLDQANVYRVKIALHVIRGEIEAAIRAALEACATLYSLDFPLHPTAQTLRQAVGETRRELGDRAIEELAELPAVADPEMEAAIALLSTALPAAFFTDSRLHDLMCCRLVSLSLRYGNSDFSAHGYVIFGATLGQQFENWSEGYRFGMLAWDLAERGGFTPGGASAYYTLGAFIVSWVCHIRETTECLRQALHASIETGDMNIACFSSLRLAIARLVQGDPLVQVAVETERQIDFTRRAQNGAVAGFLSDFHLVVQGLRGVGEDGGEGGSLTIPLSTDNPDWRSFTAFAIRATAALFFGDFAAAADLPVDFHDLRGTGSVHFLSADLCYAVTLCRTAHYDQASTERQAAYRREIDACRELFAAWRKHGPENFGHRHALVSAEAARLAGADLEAMRFYEQAVLEARKNGFVHNEGLACEFAARFYRERNLEINAVAYLRRARDCYLRWGANGKVRQLDAQNPGLLQQEEFAGDAGMEAQIGRMDTVAVAQASQAISGEILLSNLLDTLMRIVLENAGARKGSLLLVRGEALSVVAEGWVEGETVEVRSASSSTLPLQLPTSVTNYVRRTRERVILEDASGGHPFSADAYMRRHRPLSVLCLPVLRQGKLVALLYLENNLAPGVFTAERTAVLEVLAAQAAISLENAHLYTQLAESERKFRAIFDQTFQFIGLMTTDGNLIEVNRTAKAFVGADESEVLDRPFWETPWWRHSSPLQQQLREAIEKAAAGDFVRFEATHPAADGRLHHIDFSLKPVRDESGEVVLLIPEGRDITERKQSEQEISRLNAELERKMEELVAAQEELVRREKLAVLGQLSGSVGHELRNPLGVMNNAVYFLQMVLTNADETTKEYLGIIKKEIDHSQRIITDLLDFTRTRSPRRGAVAVADLVAESLEKCTIPEGVEMQTEIPEELPALWIDSLQMQQVLQNLVTNGIQAMPAGGRLRIAARRERPEDEAGRSQGAVQISVSDTGQGIAPENMKYLFQPLFTTKARGIGLGLVICRNLTEANDGRIEVESSVGEGACFKLTLPAGGA